MRIGAPPGGGRGRSIPEFSYWRMRSTVPDEYRSDCAEMRRMFQGEPLLPTFLSQDRVVIGSAEENGSKGEKGG
jgi:hypothetical protein